MLINKCYILMRQNKQEADSPFNFISDPCYVYVKDFYLFLFVNFRFHLSVVYDSDIRWSESKKPRQAINTTFLVLFL